MAAEPHMNTCLMQFLSKHNCNWIPTVFLQEEFTVTVLQSSSPPWYICTSVSTPSWCNLDASHFCIKSFLYLRVHRGETTLCGEAMCDIYNFSWYFFQACGNLGPFVSMRTADNTTLEKVRDECGNFSSNCANSQKLKQPWHFKI